jgi:DNA-binding transcriptional LysR family regulator
MDQLESFVAVAEEQHFGRAATRLHITQPPLSRRIQLLEEQLGVDLFDRSRRAVKLTPAGRVFLVDARKILTLAQEAALSARRTPRGETGLVTIAFTASSAYTLLDKVVSAANTEFPHVELVLREMVSQAQLEALLAGTIDIGMIRPPVTGADIITRPLSTESLLAALPAEHRLATRKTQPSIEDFNGEQFIGYSPAEARYFHEILVGAFRAAHVRPVYAQYVTQIHTMLAMVKAELGIAMVPAAAAALHFDGVVLRPVLDVPADLIELHMAWRRSNDNPAAKALLPVIKRAAE